MLRFSFAVLAVSLLTARTLAGAAAPTSDTTTTPPAYGVRTDIFVDGEQRQILMGKVPANPTHNGVTAQEFVSGLEVPAGAASYTAYLPPKEGKIAGSVITSDGGIGIVAWNADGKIMSQGMVKDRPAKVADYESEYESLKDLLMAMSYRRVHFVRADFKDGELSRILTQRNAISQTASLREHVSKLQIPEETASLSITFHNPHARSTLGAIALLEDGSCEAFSWDLKTGVLNSRKDFGLHTLATDPDTLYWQSQVRRSSTESDYSSLPTPSLTHIACVLITAAICGSVCYYRHSNTRRHSRAC